MFFLIIFLVFCNFQTIEVLKIQVSRFKVLTGKDLSSNFSKNNLISDSKVQDKTECPSLCNQNSFCSTALYKQNKECQLFNKLLEDGDLIDSSGSDVFVKYPRSCKQIKRFNPLSKNGLYDIETPNGKIQVFCEFELDNEGYTFFPRDSLDIADKNFLKDIYLNQTIFLTKYLILNKNIQPFVFVQQLDKNSQEPIIIYINEGFLWNVNKISNIKNTKYFKISLVNESKVSQNQQYSNYNGFKANRHDLTYGVCCNLPYRNFAFFQMLSTSNSNGGGEGLYTKYINFANNSKSNSSMPLHYFYTMEFHMGCCGGVTLSNYNKNNDAYAFAFGVK